MGSEVYVEVPLRLTPEMIKAIKDDPSTCIEDKEEWYTRLGWLICAWEVLLNAAPMRHER